VTTSVVPVTIARDHRREQRIDRIARPDLLSERRGERGRHGDERDEDDEC